MFPKFEVSDPFSSIMMSFMNFQVKVNQPYTKFGETSV